MLGVVGRNFSVDLNFFYRKSIENTRNYALEIAVAKKKDGIV